jgi:glycine/D-amino acid oxidase-like deaminating enzyme
MTVSHWQQIEQTHRDVDFLVVGAGLAGSSAAYFAQQVHNREVVVTDARDVALGASSRNAGFMISGIADYYHQAIEMYGRDKANELWKLSHTTINHWKTFIKNSPFDVPLDNCGSMLLAESEEEAKEVERAAKALEADNIEIEYYSNDPLGRGYYAGIYQPMDAGTQPYLLAKSVLQQSGAEVITNNELYRIEQTTDDYVTVHTQKIIFRAKYVMLCTNAYSPMIDPYFVSKVIPTRAQCLVTEPLDEKPIDYCGYSDYGYMYYRTTFDGRLLIGGGRNQFTEEEHDTTEDRLNHNIQAYLDSYLAKYFPDVSASVAHRWSGIMGFSVDGLPLVGKLPNMSRVGFAVGFTGHGLAMSAGTTERAVDMLLNGASVGALDAARLA